MPTSTNHKLAIIIKTIHVHFNYPIGITYHLKYMQHEFDCTFSTNIYNNIMQIQTHTHVDQFILHMQKNTVIHTINHTVLHIPYYSSIIKTHEFHRAYIIVNNLVSSATAQTHHKTHIIKNNFLLSF